MAAQRETDMTKMAMLAAILALTFTNQAQAELARKESPYPMSETIERFEGVLKERGLTVFSKIDHAAGARQINQDLRPTVLIIFGSPAVGTPLIQAEQTMGLSLPLKALIWQDAAGKIWLGYDAPASVAAERGVAKDHPVIGRMTGALAGIVDAVVMK